VNGRPRYDIAYFALGAASFGGAERSILELASAQALLGRRVLLLCEPALLATDFVAAAESRGLPLRAVDWAPEHTLPQVIGAAWRLFAELDAAIIHFNISWRPRMWVIPWIARLRTHAKLVGTMRAMPEAFSDLPHRRYFGVVPGPRIWAWPDYLIGRVWARTLHRTVSVNRDDYPPRLVRAFGFPRSRLSVIYNGVHIPSVPPSPEARAAARRRLGIPGDEFVSAYVGRVSPEKGVRVLLEALARAPAAISLVVAGDGSDLEPMRRLAGELGIEGRVRFLGYVSPATDVFTAADVVVVPSLWNEAFGRVVVEAMACGTAVVATSVGGMQEIFEHERQGLLVPKGDAAAIAAALTTLAADAGRRQSLADAGFAHVRQTFSIERVCQQYSALYAAVSGPSAASAGSDA
jgi:glycosyltransferase involved in cell wall biosynthesis